MLRMPTPVCTLHIHLFTIHLYLSMYMYYRTYYTVLYYYRIMFCAALSTYLGFDSFNVASRVQSYVIISLNNDIMYST